MRQFRDAICYLFVILVVLFMFAVAVSIAHGSTTPAPRPNGIGVLETYQNPNTYLFAQPIDITVLDENFTNVRFHPYATSLLYDETVLFCGNVMNRFTANPLIVTYATSASGRFKGVGCHHLINVYQTGEQQ